VERQTGVTGQALAEQFANWFPHLNERQRQLVGGAVSVVAGV